MLHFAQVGGGLLGVWFMSAVKVQTHEPIRVRVRVRVRV